MCGMELISIEKKKKKWSMMCAVSFYIFCKYSFNHVLISMFRINKHNYSQTSPRLTNLCNNLRIIGNGQ